MLDLHIYSGLQNLISHIPLPFKVPENYYSFVVPGFLRNNVCLFRGSVPHLEHSIFLEVLLRK